MRSGIKEPAGAPIHVLEIIGNAIVGGMENYVFNLAGHLPELGFKISCLAPYESAYTASLRSLGCEVYITPMHVEVPWRSIQFTTEIIRQKHIDLVHAHLARAHILAGLSGRLTNRPVVATFHGMEINVEEFGISQLTGTHIVTVCHSAYNQALALGMPPERVSLVYNAVDTHTFHPHHDGKAARSELNLPADVPLVGFVGRLSWEKGPDQFVHMARRIHERRPDAHFVMIGDGPMANEIRQMTQTTSLEDVFHFCGQNDHMENIYPALDVQAISSRVEGMPFALLEGMACGLPVAAMAVGGVSEIIEVHTTGLTSAPEDSTGLAEAVLWLLDHPQEARAMGQAARKRVVASYSINRSMPALASLFKTMVKDRLAIFSTWDPTLNDSASIPVKPPPGVTHQS